MLYPVMILLILFVVWAIFELGGFVYEGAVRKRDPKQMEDYAIHARTLMDDGSPEARTVIEGCSSTRYVRGFIADLTISDKLSDPRLERARVL